MIYIFGLLLIYTLYSQWNKLIEEKRNLLVFIILSLIGISMGLIHELRTYSNSIAYMIEKAYKLR